MTLLNGIMYPDDIERSSYIPKDPADPVRCFLKAPPSAEDDGWWDGPGWYFYDETWSELHGPIASHAEAQAACAAYAETL